MTLVMGTLSLRYSERLIMRYGARTVMLPGLVLVLIAMLLFTRAPVHGSYAVDVLPTMIVLAIGIGVSFPALMTLAMSGATPEDAGLASGLVNTSVQVGGALGLAVLATLAATRTHHLQRGPHPSPAALTSGYHLAFWAAAALVAAAIAVTVSSIRAPREATASRASRYSRYGWLRTARDEQRRERGARAAAGRDGRRRRADGAPLPAVPADRRGAREATRLGDRRGGAHGRRDPS
jgi:MFS family permease